jgi:Carboxypeptidase regulatory-like domain
MMMRRSIQLNQLMSWTVHVGVIKTRRVCQSADVGNRRLKYRSHVQLLAIRGPHVFGAPADVPDRGDNFKRRRTRYLIEKNPRFLRPNRILPFVAALFTIEMMRVKLNGGRGIRRIQVNVMEVRHGFLLREGSDACQKADNADIHYAWNYNANARQLEQMSLAKTLVSAGLFLFSAFATEAVRISGTVMDMSGSPVQYEAVSLFLIGNQEVLKTIPADRDGKFVFADLEPHWYVLVVQPPNYMATRKEVDATAGRDVDVGTLQLRIPAICDQMMFTRRRFSLHFLHPAKTYRVSGKVVDRRGTAVPNASVILADSCIGFRAYTGPDGTFHLRHVRPSTFTVEVKGAGFLPFEDLSVTVGKQKRNTDLGTIVVGLNSLKSLK